MLKFSVQAFCERHNIGNSTSHKWQNRHKNKEDYLSTTAVFENVHIIISGTQPLLALYAIALFNSIYNNIHF